MVVKRVRHGLRRSTKRILDKIEIDDKILGTSKRLLDKTTVDDHIIRGVKRVKKKVRKHIITAITAAFGFLIALSWRDAISSWINTLIESFNLSEGWYKFVAALIVTFIGVLGIILVSRLEQKEVKV